MDWAVPTEILELELSAWIASAEGKYADAIQLMTKAANLEDATEKLPLTPGPIVPAREQLGELFLAANQPASALHEFEASLRSAPNRFGGLYGAAQAARKTRDPAKARAYFAMLVETCSHADDRRPELAEAKMFLNAE
jgi:Tfp pilus assembly protein PilF